MRFIKTLGLEECEALKKEGLLEVIIYERLPPKMDRIDKDYLSSRGIQLGANVIGIPENIKDYYGYYKSTLDIEKKISLDYSFAT